MTGSEAPAWTFTLSTVWDRSRPTPLREFLRTETGRRRHGPYDLGALSGAARAARARVLISQAARLKRAGRPGG